MKRVYCLYRVSSRRQVEKDGIPMQRIACQSYAKCHGWEIIREFTEKGVSGYKLSMDERDSITQIKEDASLKGLTSCWYSCLTALDGVTMKRPL